MDEDQTNAGADDIPKPENRTVGTGPLGFSNLPTGPSGFSNLPTALESDAESDNSSIDLIASSQEDSSTKVWQYRLWSFKLGDTKLDTVFPFIRPSVFFHSLQLRVHIIIKRI